MLKKVLCISAAALALTASLTACNTYLEKSGTYDVETGDRVKITVDAKVGYDTANIWKSIRAPMRLNPPHPW